MSKKKKNLKKKAKSEKTKKLSSPLSWLGWVLPIFAFFLYSNTIYHGFVLDDDLVCNKNKYVQAEGTSGLKDIFSTSLHQGFTGNPDRHYRPMMMAAFSIEKTIFGNKNTTFHFFNIFWFAVIAGLLFLLLKEMFRDKSIWLPFGIALLYISHPIHTEVVANIKSRDEIFVMLGLVGCLYTLLKSEQNTDKKKFWQIASILFYSLAILSKETGLQIIALVPLTLYFFTQEKNLANILKKSSVYLIPVVIYFLLRSKFTGDNGQVLGIIDNSLYAAQNMGEQLATAISMTGKYLLLLFFPHPLSFDYSAYQIPIVGFGDWRVLLSILVWGGILFLGIKGIKNKNPISYSIFLFLIMFALVSNIFFLTGVTMAERLIFTASFGFSIITGYLLFTYLYKEDKPIPFFIALSLITLLYSYKTWDRNAAWESNETLFATGIETAPNSSRTQSFYGKRIYDLAMKSSDPVEQKKLVEESILYYNRSLEIHPGFTDVHHHKGVAMDFLERYGEAKTSYENAIATKSDYHLSICNLGLVYAKMGKLEKAIELLRQSHEIAPYNTTIKNNLIAISLNIRDHFRSQGNIETAIYYDQQVKLLRGEPVENPRTLEGAKEKDRNGSGNNN